MVDHACSLCTQEAEAGGLQCSPGQHELQNETLTEKPTNQPPPPKKNPNSLRRTLEK